METKHIAKLLIVNSKNTLSTQLQKITGDTWNEIDFTSYERSDVIRHKSSKKWFIVLSETHYENLNKEALSDLMSYYRKSYNFCAIRSK